MPFFLFFWKGLSSLLFSTSKVGLRQMFDGTSRFKATLIQVSLLQHFSRCDNSTSDAWIYPSERSLICICDPPAATHSHNRMINPMPGVTLPFPLAPLFLFRATLRKNASHFLGSCNWLKNNSGQPSKARRSWAKSPIYH